MRMLKAACASGRYCRLPKWPWPRTTSNPSLGCSVNKTLGHWLGHGCSDSVKAHLHCIRDLGPSIRVRARTQSKQVNLCFVFTLIRVRVRDFCLGRPCPSSSLHVAISSDTDVRVHPRLCNAHAQSRLCTWSLLQATKMAMASDNLGSEPRM